MTDNFEPPKYSADPEIAARQKRSQRIVIGIIVALVALVAISYFSMRSSFGI